MILDKYTSSSVSKHITLEGTSLVQRASNKHLPPYDKYWKICDASYAYRKVTHNHILKKAVTNTKSEKQIDEGKYNSIKSSKSTKTSKAASITKFHNSQIKMKKSFTTLNSIIEDMDNEDSDLTNSDEDDEENSHFQFEEIYWFQVVHKITVVLPKLPNKSFVFNQYFF